MTSPDQTPLNPVRTALLGLAVLLISLPISALVTFLASPIWALLERTTGIEAVGHSGPDEWCFVVTYAVVVIGIGSRCLWKRRSPSTPP